MSSRGGCRISNRRRSSTVRGLLERTGRRADATTSTAKAKHACPIPDGAKSYGDVREEKNFPEKSSNRNEPEFTFLKNVHACLPLAGFRVVNKFRVLYTLIISTHMFTAIRSVRIPTGLFQKLEDEWRNTLMGMTKKQIEDCFREKNRGSHGAKGQLRKQRNESL